MKSKKIVPLKTPDMKAVRSLLSFYKLPVADLETAPLQFFGIKTGKTLISVGAFETYGENSILRSLAVNSDYINCGNGKQMVKFIENEARISGIKHLFLLTTTAEIFFKKEGYVVFDRNLCPYTIQSSAEFSSLCPSTAVCMKKDLISKQEKQT